MSRLDVRLWGVRGSIPAPGRETAFFGGNTSCISVESSRGVLILDAGSGIRKLGLELAKHDKPIYLVITHNHWDHVQGFPFFVPAYQKGRRLFILPYHDTEEVLCALLAQMDGVRFPVTPDQLGSRHEVILHDQLAFLAEAGFQVESIETNHPGGCHGYRVRGERGALVYIPDNELDPPGRRILAQDELVRFCRGADVLIHDAQYLRAEMPAKAGWGHSAVEDVAELAVAAGPRQLVLFHHDPERTDAQVCAIQQRVRSQLALRAPEVACAAAREGMRFLL